MVCTTDGHVGVFFRQWDIRWTMTGRGKSILFANSKGNVFS